MAQSFPHPFRKVKSICENHDARELYDYFISPNFVQADLAFQSSDQTRWNPQQGSSYITSLMTGMAPSKFIFADVDECYNEAVRADAPDNVDKDYFEYWISKGVKYLNIDSNNRVINITSFVNGEFGIEPGCYEDPESGLTVNVLKDINDRYEGEHAMPASFKRLFDKALISVEKYETCNREELSRLFIRINDGQSLNHPEMRNAETSELAKTIRKIAKKDFDLLVKHGKFSDTDKKRRGVDGFVAMCCYLYYEGVISNTSPADLLRFYKYGRYSNTKISEFANCWRKFVNQILKHDELLALTAKNNLFDLWHIFSNMERMTKSEDEVVYRFFLNETNQVEFINDYIDAVAFLLGEKDPKTGKLRMYDMPNKPSPKQFDTMIRGLQMSNNIMRHRLIVKKMDFLVEDEDGSKFPVKYWEKRDKKREATPNQKLVNSSKQKWVTPVGVPIKRNELHDGEKYQGGHDVAWSKGGETSNDNIVIQTKEENSKQGTKRVRVVT